MDIALLSEGLGWHLSGWVRSISNRNDVEKVFLSDPSRYNVEMVRGFLGDKLKSVYDSPEALFRENEVEIAIVDTAPIRTPDMIQASLEAGVPIIVEKPAATSPEDYAPLVELADSKGLLMAISLIEPPPVREATKMVAEGQLGRIYNIRYLLSDHQRWRIRDQMGWVYSKKEAGGGMLGHEFCHILHCMPRMLGSAHVRRCSRRRHSGRLGSSGKRPQGTRNTLPQGWRARYRPRFARSCLLLSRSELRPSVSRAKLAPAAGRD